MNDAEFAKQLEACRPALMRAASREYPLSSPVRQDVVQATMVKAWGLRDRYDSARPLAGWLTMMLHNLAIDWKRRAETRHVSLQALCESDRSYEVSVEDESVDSALKTDLTVQVKRAIKLLPETYRKVLTMRILEDRTYDEIAAALDMPVGTVRSQLNRGRVTLRALLQDYIDGKDKEEETL